MKAALARPPAWHRWTACKVLCPFSVLAERKRGRGGGGVFVSPSARVKYRAIVIGSPRLKYLAVRSTFQSRTLVYYYCCFLYTLRVGSSTRVSLRKVKITFFCAWRASVLSMTGGGNKGSVESRMLARDSSWRTGGAPFRLV